eukprot:gene4258-6037_t
MGNKNSSETTQQNDNAVNNGNNNNNNPVTAKSYWAMANEGYKALVNAIIRPPRSDYDIDQLGPTEFKFCNRNFIRKDFELVNERKMKICCSMWEPTSSERQSPTLPCVIYMHGNSSSRLEAIPQLALVLSLGATLLTLDFCGSGKSEGEYVSLGSFERDDLQAVIEYLREAGTTSTIALWGRSMGAATALLHGERDPSIAGMILDSAFSDLVILAEEMVEKGRQQGLFAPGFIIKIAIKFIRSSVQKLAGFDIKDLSPVTHADKCFIPALFIAAEHDLFVPKHHSQMIHDKYGGDKNLIIVEGDHNSQRPLFLFHSASIFLITTLQIPEHWILTEGQNSWRRAPWPSSYILSRLRPPVTGQQAHGQSNQQIQHNKILSDEEDSDEELSIEDIIALTMLDDAQRENEANNNNNETNKISNHDDVLEDQVGKSAEMQGDIQSKILGFFGGGKSTAVADSRDNANNRPILSSPLSMKYNTTNQQDVDSSKQSNGLLTTDNSTTSSDNNNKNNFRLNIKNNNLVTSQPTEWICSICTLLNLPDCFICDACGMDRDLNNT